MSEPNLELFHGTTLVNRIYAGFSATRPAFFTASVLPVLVGLALARHLGGPLHTGLALLTLAAIVLIHAAANVLNDYFDARNGTDALNRGRIFPFSGGSRFIQNGVLSLAETRRLGLGLLAAGVFTGLWVAALSGPLLVLLGLLGCALAYFYSAPPCLACRGLGDLTITLCFGVLPVAGTVWIQLGQIPPAAWGVGTGVGLFTAAILWINSIPDIDADRRAGKLTLPVRLGKRYAVYGLPLLFGLGFATLGLTLLPAAAGILALALIPALQAVRALSRGRMLPAIPLTLLTHAAVCLLLCAGLIWRWPG